MERLDKTLLRLGLFPSREKARDAILLGTVRIDGKRAGKPSRLVSGTEVIEVVDLFNRYVGRGGLKLEKAISDFDLDFQGKRILDLGASTGGFSDCALRHGAAFCYCVDVGTGQLHETLRQNPQVKNIEQKDFRELRLEDIDNLPVDAIVGDLSFISLTFLFPCLPPFLKEDGIIVLLIKPQFEAGPSFLNKSGVVSDTRAYPIAIQKVVSSARLHGFHLQKITPSTLFEVNKNMEFLALFTATNPAQEIDYPGLLAETERMKKSLRKK